MLFESSGRILSPILPPSSGGLQVNFEEQIIDSDLFKPLNNQTVSVDQAEFSDQRNPVIIVSILSINKVCCLNNALLRKALGRNPGGFQQGLIIEKYKGDGQIKCSLKDRFVLIESPF
jgi:hypothetical protein